MADKSNIEWTDASWNPIVGCSLESPGCTHCYAMRQAFRIQAMMRGLGKESHYDGTTKVVKGKPVWTGLMRQAPEHILLQPLRWTTPRMIFVNSMSDLFHPDVPDAWIDQVFAVMALCPQHTFQVLTKRADRMRTYLASTPVHRIWMAMPKIDQSALGCAKPQWPLPNVWLGVSAEDQRRYDERRDDLRATPAAVRFLSIEPLLGPIGLDLSGLSQVYRPIHWVIVGGESGPNARPMHPDWARSLRDQCAAAGVPFFFKQWGEWVSAEAPGRSDETGVLMPDGEFLRGRRVLDWQGDDGWIVKRVGKSRAGRLLDGREHNDMPEASR